jgi:hypothetical protein
MRLDFVVADPQIWKPEPAFGVGGGFGRDVRRGFTRYDRHARHDGALRIGDPAGDARRIDAFLRAGARHSHA